MRNIVYGVAFASPGTKGARTTGATSLPNKDSRRSCTVFMMEQLICIIPHAVMKTRVQPLTSIHLHQEHRVQKSSIKFRFHDLKPVIGIKKRVGREKEMPKMLKPVLYAHDTKNSWSFLHALAWCSCARVPLWRAVNMCCFCEIWMTKNFDTTLGTFSLAERSNHHWHMRLESLECSKTLTCYMHWLAQWQREVTSATCMNLSRQSPAPRRYCYLWLKCAGAISWRLKKCPSPSLMLLLHSMTRVGWQKLTYCWFAVKCSFQMTRRPIYEYELKSRLWECEKYRDWNGSNNDAIVVSVDGDGNDRIIEHEPTQSRAQGGRNVDCFADVVRFGRSRRRLIMTLNGPSRARASRVNRVYVNLHWRISHINLTPFQRILLRVRDGTGSREFQANSREAFALLSRMVTVTVTVTGAAWNAEGWRFLTKTDWNSPRGVNFLTNGTATPTKMARTLSWPLPSTMMKRPQELSF